MYNRDNMYLKPREIPVQYFDAVCANANFLHFAKFPANEPRRSTAATRISEMKIKY